MGCVLQYFTNVIKKRCTAFLISDFIAPEFEKALMIASKKHDLVALQVYDIKDTYLPDVGLLKVQDSESGRVMYVDTSNDSVRKLYSDKWQQRQSSIKRSFSKTGVDMVSVSTSEDYVRALIALFRMRGL